MYMPDFIRKISAKNVFIIIKTCSASEGSAPRPLNYLPRIFPGSSGLEEKKQSAMQNRNTIENISLFLCHLYEAVSWKPADNEIKCTEIIFHEGSPCGSPPAAKLCSASMNRWSGALSYEALHRFIEALSNLTRPWTYMWWKIVSTHYSASYNHQID